MNHAVVDPGAEGSVDDMDELVFDFEDEFQCTVAFDFPTDPMPDGTQVHGFEVLEPSWSSAQEAACIVERLMGRLQAWVTNGYLPCRGDDERSEVS